MTSPSDAKQANHFYASPQSSPFSASRSRAELEEYEKAEKVKKARRESTARYRAKTKENRDELLEYIPRVVLKQARKVNGYQEGSVYIAATRVIAALEVESEELKEQVMWLEEQLANASTKKPY